ncbi:LysM peptidoglycan-binding domain-containing protein [Vibrio fortis]|uniref:LysM peptidoglycan-binding domain-containing protein n=1 Tax=Vibrio fortis TaxID=212667 RepID=A0A5N3SA51_9VIBR|nr:LysM peptidoglycan-binding domain-containing protein [Vibrio fortis]KAB0303162.1 LysM peptidoglycan-binding domain-containing protein [Vibrio fortis]
MKLAKLCILLSALSAGTHGQSADDLYTVVSGDTASQVAFNHQLTLSQLAHQNPSWVESVKNNLDKLFIGTKLDVSLPSDANDKQLTTEEKAGRDTAVELTQAVEIVSSEELNHYMKYTVVSGDTASEVAYSHQMTLQQLTDENMAWVEQVGGNIDLLPIGTRLNVMSQKLEPPVTKNKLNKKSDDAKGNEDAEDSVFQNTSSVSSKKSESNPNKTVEHDQADVKSENAKPVTSKPVVAETSVVASKVIEPKLVEPKKQAQTISPFKLSEKQSFKKQFLNWCRSEELKCIWESQTDFKVAADLEYKGNTANQIVEQVAEDLYLNQSRTKVRYYSKNDVYRVYD